jgi:hypothetical protein
MRAFCSHLRTGLIGRIRRLLGSIAIARWSPPASRLAPEAAKRFAPQRDKAYFLAAGHLLPHSYVTIAP